MGGGLGTLLPLFHPVPAAVGKDNCEGHALHGIPSVPASRTTLEITGPRVLSLTAGINKAEPWSKGPAPGPPCLCPGLLLGLGEG